LVAKEGVRRVRARLSNVLQNPTGYYESNITVEGGAQGRWVSDNNVPYGGWLEGVDARNQTTRFKGYKTFRIVKQQLDADKEKIAQPAVDKFVRDMNS
jgi:hypothetical protein